LKFGQEYKQRMEISLSGQAVVITGASMGIGEALAKIFAEHGARIVMSSRDMARAEAARQRIGYTEQTIALACDVRNREEIDRLVGLTLHHFERIDVWINNAGHGLADSVADMDMATCRDMFDTNFFGTVQAMQAVIPIMKRQGSGTIINVSSVAGHIPLPYSAAYSATKFAMNAIGKAARAELAKTGIHVMTVCPGYVRTNFSVNRVKGKDRKEVRPQSQGGIRPERVARAVLTGYVKGKREVIVPWRDKIFIKLYQLLPGLVEGSMARMIRPAAEESSAASK
jgi:short-subunit dehydrogenase